MKARSFAPSSAAAVEARYRVERKLGQGAAGAVYLVHDRDTGEQLALKKLLHMDAKSVLRLKREFRSLQALNHPHIVRPSAIEHLQGAMRTSEALHMPHLHARDQRALGIVLGDSQGADLRGAAEQRMRELGVLDIAGDLKAFFPELAELG